MKRVPSGIKGLDDIIEGGIPENSLVLLSGPSGAGKTIFSLQFLHHSLQSEPAIFVSFEDEIPRIKSILENFGWDVEKYESRDKLRFLRYDPFRLEDIMEVVESNIREMGARRVVIDSISAIGIYVRDPPELRRMVIQISNILRKNSCTSLLISETLADKRSLSRFGVEEFVVDGVILLQNFLFKGEYKRGLNVWKMYATNHSRKIHPYRISHDGFSVSPKETLLKADDE